MKSYVKKFLLSAVLLTCGFLLLYNWYDINAPLKVVIGGWAGLTAFITMLVSVVLMFLGVVVIRQTLLDKVGEETVGSMISSKVFDFLLPAMKLWDRFMEWLNTDGSKK